MYCPKCTLEIKGEDQETCPICSETLIETPDEKTESLSDEDLKLQELIADIDLSVNKSDGQISSQESLETKPEETSAYDPDFKIEMDDKLPEPKPESGPDVNSFTFSGEESGSVPEPSDDLSLDLEKEFSLDDEMIEGEFSADQMENNFYDLEKELGLVDDKMSAVDEEPPTIDFDKFVLTQEEKSFAHDDEIEDEESEDTFVTDSKEVLEKTLEELDPLKGLSQSQKKSSNFGLIVFLIILFVVVFGITYMKFKPESEGIIKPEVAKTANDKKLKDKIEPKADKQTEKVVVKEDLVEVKEPGEEVAEKPVEAVVEQMDEKSLEKPGAEKVEKIVEVKKVIPTSRPVKEEIEVPAIPSVTYSIHAGSFRKTELAQKDVDRFNKVGFNAYIERVNLGDKGVWYRVKIGLYNTKAEAVAAEKEFLEKVKAQTRIIRNK